MRLLRVSSRSLSLETEPFVAAVLSWLRRICDALASETLRGIKRESEKYAC